jgi:hypothetical protein
MDASREQDSRPRQQYRGLLIGFLVLAVAITIWMSLPPKPVDMTFLRQLHPTKIKRDQYGYMEVKAPEAEVRQFLRKYLTREKGWRSGSGPGDVFQHKSGIFVYTMSNPAPASIGIVGSPGAKVRARMAVKPAGPVITTIQISDTRKLVIWP